MIFPFIVLATAILGIWLMMWTVKEFELNFLNCMKLIAVVFLISSTLILFFNSGREKRIIKVAKEIESAGGTMIIKSKEWIEGLPAGTVKQMGNQLIGYEEISVNLSNTGARDIRYLRELPKLDKLNVKGTYITDYQIKYVTRKFASCSVIR